jgi:predicted NBD/HSP70 family sugar kinase
MASTQISDLREEKKSAILRLFLGGITLTRKDLEVRTGISYGTISIILRQLVGAGILRTTGKQHSQGGRRADTYQLEPEAAFFGQISVSSSSMLWCVRDTHGTVRGGGSVDDYGSQDINDVLAQAARQVLVAARTVGSQTLASIGVTIPGHYRSDSDQIVKASRTRVAKLRIRKVIDALFDGPVLIESDVNAAAYVVRDTEDAPEDSGGTTVFVTVTADGVGATILLGNEIHYGAAGHAGEVHMLPVIVDGETMTFGDVVDIDAVARRIAVRQGLAEQPDIRAIRSLILDGSELIGPDYPRIVDAFAQALFLLDSILDPDTIFLAGPYVGFGTRFLQDVRSRIVDQAEPHLMDDLVLVLAPNSDDLEQQGMWRMQAAAWFGELD